LQKASVPSEALLIAGWLCYVTLVLLRVSLPSPPSRLTERRRTLVRLAAPVPFLAGIGLFFVSISLGLPFPPREQSGAARILISVAYVAIALLKEQQLVHYVADSAL